MNIIRTKQQQNSRLRINGLSPPALTTTTTTKCHTRTTTLS